MDRTGHISQLPAWVGELKIERMWERLATGNRYLMRSLVVRDLINSALMQKAQSDRAKRGERSTFTILFSPDLQRMKIEIPVKETESGILLSGGTSEDTWSSLRRTIKEHAPALAEFIGPSPRIEGADEEYFYQNTLTRLVKPTLRIFHILQFVWEVIIRFQDESLERRLPIDQILMRKADWAKDLYAMTLKYEGTAIFDARELGIPSCSCKLIHLGPVSPVS